MFIDTNVVLDVFLKRDGYIASNAILALSEQGIINGYISQGCLYTCLFVLRKKLGDRLAKAHLAGLLTIVRVAACDNGNSIRALLSDFADGEDALQHYTALSVRAQAIITRNLKDYSKSELPVYEPERFFSVKL